MTLKVQMIALAAAILPLACGVGTDALGSAAGTGAGANHEIWVTLQASDRIAILRGPEARGAQKAIDLPAGTGPHLTTFSPDGKYAYVSGMGNGDLDVIQTGTRRVVMVSEGEGRFRPVNVETGAQGGGLTEIRSGLTLGQKVVVSGQFLIDSEANLKATEARLQ